MLLSLSEDSREFWSIAVYSLGMFFMFGVSALYHRVTWSDKARAILRKCDHSAIYIMIAGTTTPVLILGLSQGMSFKPLVIIWSVTAVGVIKSIFFTQLPKLLNAVFYLLAGYMIVPYMSELSDNIGTFNIGLIVAGGVAYSLGAMSYAFKKPTLNPKVFGYHEVFHALVSIGALFHFMVVYSLIGLQL